MSSFKKKLCVELCEDRRMLATFTVTNTNDAPENSPAAIGTLRQAIFDAEVSPIADTILFDPLVFDPSDGVMDTIVLTEGQLTITDALTINGPGWDELTIDASHPVVFTQAA